MRLRLLTAVRAAEGAGPQGVRGGLPTHASSAGRIERLRVPMERAAVDPAAGEDGAERFRQFVRVSPAR